MSIPHDWARMVRGAPVGRVVIHNQEPFSPQFGWLRAEGIGGTGSASAQIEKVERSALAAPSLSTHMVPPISSLQALANGQPQPCTP